MHILLIHQAFAALDEAGGTRHYEMAHHLVNHGHKVTIIASPISYLTGQSQDKNFHWVHKRDVEPGLTILHSYAYPALHKSFFHRLIGFFSFMISSFLVGLNVRHVDIIWGTSPPIFQGVTAWLLARLKNVPFLFEVRDLWPAFAVAVGVLNNPVIISASLWLEKFLYSHADRLVVNSPGFIEHVKQRGAKHVDLVPNGADVSMFEGQKYDDETFRSRNGLTGKFIVLYAGAHGMSNDLDLLLEAAQQTGDDPEVCYVMVGDGKEKQRLQQKASSMNLNNVIFLPPVKKVEMAQILHASDACIGILKPIEMYKTTYPNKIFDYMAAGRPVILAIDGVIRDVVEKAGAGIATKPGDASEITRAVNLLKNDPQKSKSMGESGKRYVIEHFNRPQLADKFAAILEDVRRCHVRENPRS